MFESASDGPIPRKTTGLDSLPVMIKPPIITLSPISTRSRVEIFKFWAGVPVGVAVAVAVGVAVAVAVGVDVAVAEAVGVAVAVAIGVQVAVAVGVAVAVAVAVGVGMASSF